MAFYEKLAMNASVLTSAKTGIALSDPGKFLHGFFWNQTDAELVTALSCTLEIWAKNPSGTYVKIVSQGDPDTDTWVTGITGATGSFQKYIQLGNINVTATPSAGHILQLPHSANWRIVANPTNGADADTLVVVALLSDGLS